MTTAGFWRNYAQDNRNVLLTGFGQIGTTRYLFPDGNGPRGSFTTFEELAQVLKSRDTILLGGVLREQAVAPLDVYDVSIIGVANMPRQATSGGVPTGGGACWLAPTSPVAATPLLELRAQGWSIENVEFTPVNASAAIRLTRSASVDTIDASHFMMRDCYIAGNGGTTQIGVEDNGGCSRVHLIKNRFESLGGTAVLSLNTAAAVPAFWRIYKNRFNNNTNAIAISLTEGLIDWNYIRQTANDANNKINLVSVAGQGSLNQVIKNILSDAAANVTIAKGYKPGTNDVWRNWVTDAADEVVTVPA